MQIQEKISAIIDMPVPKNKVELQRFLGMCNYLGKFFPDLANVTAPLCCLLEKDIPWHFEAEQENAVKKLKEMVTSAPVLKYFSPKDPIKVTCDTSKLGLGAKGGRSVETCCFCFSLIMPRLRKRL